MSDHEHDGNEERERRLLDAKALFALMNKTEEFDQMVAAIRAGDRDTIARMIGELPPLLLGDGEGANTGLHTLLLTGTRRLMKDHPAWLDLRHKVTVFFDEAEAWAMQQPEGPERTITLAMCAASREMCDPKEEFSA